MARVADELCRHRPGTSPWGRVESAEDEQVILRLADGGVLVLATFAEDDVQPIRLALHRWSQHATGPVHVLLVGSEALESRILEADLARPDRRVHLWLSTTGNGLWDSTWPEALDALLQASAPGATAWSADAGPQESAESEESTEPEDATEPEALAEPARDLAARLAHSAALHEVVDGVATLQTLDGGVLFVGDRSGQAALRARLFAASLAGSRPLRAIITSTDDEGSGAAWSVDARGTVRPRSEQLQALVRLPLNQSRVDAMLDEGTLRQAHGVFGPNADDTPLAQLGALRRLVDELDDARLVWFDGERAWIRLAPQHMAEVRWLGPDTPAEACQAWQLTAQGASWVGHTVDLILLGGDANAWGAVEELLPTPLPGLVYHLADDGEVNTRAGLVAPFRRLTRVLARLGPPGAHMSELALLKQEVEERSARAYQNTASDLGLDAQMLRATPWVTHGLIAINLIVYTMALRFGGSLPVVVRLGAVQGNGRSTEPWDLLAFNFIHADLFHIGFNLMALYVLGRRLEVLLGPHRFLALYTVGGLCAGWTAATWSPNQVTIGASGAILALLGAQAAMLVRRRELFPARLIGLLQREVLLTGLIVVGTSLLPFVSGAAHLGGTLAGMVLAGSGLLTLGVEGTRSSERATEVSQGVVTTAIAAVCAALIVGSLALAWSHGTPWVLDGSRRPRTHAWLDSAISLRLPSHIEVVEAAVSRGTLHVVAGDPYVDGLSIELLAWHGDPKRRWLQADAADFLRLKEAAGTPTETRELREELGGAFVDSLVDDNGLAVRAATYWSDGGVVQVVVRTTSAAEDAERVLASLEVGDWHIEGPSDRAIAVQFLSEPGLPAPDADLAAVFRGEIEGWSDSRRVTLAGMLGDRGQAKRAIPILPSDNTFTSALTRSTLLQDAGDAQGALNTLELLELPWWVRWARDSSEPLLEVDLLVLLRRIELLQALGRDTSEQLAEADHVAELWLAASPESPSRLATMGWLRYLAGDHQACVTRSDEALVLLPDLDMARLNGALCTAALGDGDEARRRYDRVFEGSTYLERSLFAGGRRDLVGLSKSGEHAELAQELIEAIDAIR